MLFESWLGEILIDGRFQAGERVVRSAKNVQQYGGLTEENQKKMRASGIDWQVAGERIYLWNSKPPQRTRKSKRKPS